MMTLHENELLFQQLLEETQKHTGIALPYVEKDYWVTYAVQKLFSSPQKEKSWVGGARVHHWRPTIKNGLGGWGCVGILSWTRYPPSPPAFF